MWEGFLYICASKIDLETPAFNYTLSIPAMGKGHGRSIYPKHPYTHFKENQNPIQRKTSVGDIPTGTTLYRIQLRHIHIINRQSANRSINDR